MARPVKYIDGVHLILVKDKPDKSERNKVHSGIPRQLHKQFATYLTRAEEHVMQYFFSLSSTGWVMQFTDIKRTCNIKSDDTLFKVFRSLKDKKFLIFTENVVNKDNKKLTDLVVYVGPMTVHDKFG